VQPQRREAFISSARLLLITVKPQVGRLCDSLLCPYLHLLTIIGSSATSNSDAVHMATIEELQSLEAAGRG